MAQAQRKIDASTTMPTQPVTVSVLSDLTKVNAQRLYSMVRRGQIRSQRLTGRRVVIPVDEVKRVMSSATTVVCRGGPRTYFDLDALEERI
jgi:hypothetical protein